MKELILTTNRFVDIRRLDMLSIDMDIGNDNDFEFKVESSAYRSDIQIGRFIYSPASEYGGIIGSIKTDTSQDCVTFSGYTWRGLLDKKIIVPPTGEDYYRITTATDLNTVIRDLLRYVWGNTYCPFDVTSDLTGVTINNYKFDRYISLLHGIRKMLKTKGYRLRLRYNPSEDGCIRLSAVPIVNYAADDGLELSQDTQIDFVFKEVKNGVNHLIALGQGELSERTVINYYVQQDGTIGSTQYYFGIDEIAEVYENTNAENDEALETYALERFNEIRDSQSFSMDIESLGINVEIGDIVGGRDYLSGMSMEQPVKSIIWRQENGEETIDYTLEGSE